MKALSIAREQNGDGGWNFYRRGSASGIDDSAGAVEALAVAGGHARAVTRGAAFIARQRSADGGFPLAQGGPSNAQSTAWAVQALTAAGRSPGAAPLRYLARLQGAGGAIRYSHGSAPAPR